MNQEIITILNKPTIISIVGDTNTGKTNTIHSIINEINKEYQTNTHSFKAGIGEPIHSLEELEQIQNSIIIIDEFIELFDLDDRKKVKQIENTLSLTHHNNNIIILIGLPENFKKFISSKCEYIIYKKSTLKDFINGSRHKSALNSYIGHEKGSTILNLQPQESLIYKGLKWLKIETKYIKKEDTKKNNENILKPKCANNVQ